MFVRPRNEFAVKTSRKMKKTTSIFTKTEISRDKLGLWVNRGPYKGQLISKGLIGNLILPQNERKIKLYYDSSGRLDLRSFFGRNSRYQRDISRLTDL